MAAPLFYFVKPHPPRSILDHNTPLPENYKYNWEPLVLKYLVWELKKSIPEISSQIWHLMNTDDEEDFLKSVQDESPLAVFFTEIDILVNPVNELAQAIKKINNNIITVVGGKHSSLLQPGDRLPFGNIDFVISGDGIEPMKEISAHILKNRTLHHELFLSWNRDTRTVTRIYNNQRDIVMEELSPAFRFLPVENHTETEYLTEHQTQPALNPVQARNAPLLIGTGCPHDCIFCQAPVEFGKSVNAYLMRSPKTVAEEISLLQKKWKVNNLFSLESNMNLPILKEIYGELEQLGIDSFPISGFVRISDIAKSYKTGLLPRLAEKGMRFIHTGIDCILNSKNDAYRKHNSREEILDCLHQCIECGIVVMGTYIGNPDTTVKGFEKQLETLALFPAADIDIRLAIALRNTAYFTEVEKYLLYHPDKNQHYFDVQNYRYQTIQFPRKITPEQTYAAIKHFYDEFYSTPAHHDYVQTMISRHPDTKDFFLDQYKKKNLEFPYETGL